MVGLLRPVIDSFGELRRSRASGQKQSLQAFPQSAESGWLPDAAVAPVRESRLAGPATAVAERLWQVFL